MSKIFDPFDDGNRDKRPRRKSENVQAEKRDWHKKIDGAIAETLAEYNNADYVKSCYLIEDAGGKLENFGLIKRNLTASLLRLNYVKMPAKTKDGRWKIDGINTFVYKQKNAPDLTFSQLKEYFE